MLTFKFLAQIKPSDPNCTTPFFTSMVSQVYDKNPDLTHAIYLKLHQLSIPFSSTLYQYFLMSSEMNNSTDSIQ